VRSIQLQPEILLHFRKRGGWRLKEVAECLRRGRQQTIESLINVYHRIERTGQTSPATAARIAERLGVSVATLTGEERPAGVQGLLWLERQNDETSGRLCHGFSLAGRLREGVASNTAWLTFAPCIRAYLQVERDVCRFAVREEPPRKDAFDWWSVRVARRTAHGLSWIPFTEMEQSALLYSLKSLAMDVADEVQVDCELTPPARSPIVYELQAHPETRGARCLPTRSCDTEAALRDAMAQGLRLPLGSKIALTDGGSAIGIRVLDTPHHYTVVRSWIGPDGVLHPAPWAQHRRKLFRQEIATWLRAACSDVSFYQQDVSGRWEPAPIPEDEIDRDDLVIGSALATARAYASNPWK
jgi:hypothetical protein